MRAITRIYSNQIFDSRGVPTLKTTVTLGDGATGSFSVPSGGSTGKNEALERRDRDKNKYEGRGVLKAIENVVGPIFEKVKGSDPLDQKKLDELLINVDGTENKSNLGANAILSVSVATAVAAANSKKNPLFKHLGELFENNDENFHLPTPMVNLIEGGKHASNKISFQEFLAIPLFEDSFSNKVQIIEALIKKLEELFKEKGINYKLGMEGGFDINVGSNENALDIFSEAIGETGKKFEIGLDIAASSFFENGKYKVKADTEGLNSSDYQDHLASLVKKYDLFSLEDPLHEESWDAWANFMKLVSDKSLVVADDLSTTNLGRLSKVVAKKSANGVIAKPNQVGTLSETFDFISSAREAGMKIIVSHRGGETDDSFISDLAVGVGAEFIKAGSPLKKERKVKYDRLVAIEKVLNS